MPVTPTYPGVYIEEIPSGVRTITGVATSITAFIGAALKGPTDLPLRVQNFTEFERNFGGLWRQSPMSYAVQQYFLNGGSDAVIVRIVEKAVKAKGDAGTLKLEAASEGTWGNQIGVTIDHNTKDSSDDKLFNLAVQMPAGVTVETFRNVSVDPLSSRFVTKVLAQESTTIRVSSETGSVPATRPAEVTTAVTFTGGSDGDIPAYGSYNNAFTLLDQADLINLLCIPPRESGTAVLDDNGGQALLSEALAYCQKRRAMLLVDPPSSWTTVANVLQHQSDVNSLRNKNAVIFYPLVKLPDPLQENRIEAFPPCGVMAGIFARTDTQRGVWKAPAGTEATLSGVRELSYKMTDGENGQLNPLGINCLRTFPVYGNVAWGSRTLEGADQLASEWKYLPVRRMALFMEESLYRGTQWVVFEPNDEPLWAQIRLNIGAFMNNLFRQGAFQGKSPKEAYFVKCDSETTTQNDINLGIVNIIVGFAPLKPAEFVIIKLQQMAGQIAT